MSRATTSPLRGTAGQLEPQLPRLARLVDLVETLHRALRLRRLAGELLGLVDAKLTDVLVGLVVHRSTHLRLTLLRPLALLLGPVGE